MNSQGRLRGTHRPPQGLPALGSAGSSGPDTHFARTPFFCEKHESPPIAGLRARWGYPDRCSAIKDGRFQIGFNLDEVGNADDMFRFCIASVRNGIRGVLKFFECRISAAV